MSDDVTGKPLPSVALESTEGRTVQLPDDLKGKWTVLYTYPKDDTPGCTKEACSFRDNKEQFDKAGVRLYGVSLDDLDSHRAFVEKYGINFPLLADTEHRLTEALGSYGDQEWQGQVFKGVSRDTFLVDPDGVVRAAWRKVNPINTMHEAWEELQRHL